jgi:hypothetical protein
LRERAQSRASQYAAARQVTETFGAHAEWAEGLLEREGYDATPLINLHRRHDPTHLGDAAGLLARALAKVQAVPKQPVEECRAPEVAEIRRAAGDLLSAISGWETWVLTTGREIQGLPDYGHDTQTPPKVIQGMSEAVALERRARLAFQALDRHGCLPPSLREAMSVLPSYPRGQIQGERDKRFAAAAQESLPAIQELAFDLEEWIDEFEYSPLSYIGRTSRQQPATGAEEAGERALEGAVEQRPATAKAGIGAAEGDGPTAILDALEAQATKQRQAVEESQRQEAEWARRQAAQAALQRCPEDASPEELAHRVAAFVRSLPGGQLPELPDQTNLLREDPEAAAALSVFRQAAEGEAVDAAFLRQIVARGEPVWGRVRRLIRDQIPDGILRQIAWAPSHAANAGTGQAEGHGAGTPDRPEPAGIVAKKPKKSTERGEGRERVIATLTQHHQYENGSCLNLEPIRNNELARKAGVSKSTVSEFFKKDFKGRLKYRAICRDAGRLADSLKALRGEFSPHDLYGRTPPGEGSPEDE